MSNSPTSKARIRRGIFKGLGHAGDYKRLKEEEEFSLGIRLNKQKQEKKTQQCSMQVIQATIRVQCPMIVISLLLKIHSHFKYRNHLFTSWSISCISV